MKVTRGLKIIINVDLINTYKITPTQYCILYYLYHDLDVQIGPNMHNALYHAGMLEKDEIKLTEIANKLFYEDPKQWGSSRVKEFLTELREFFPKGVVGGNVVKTTIGESTIRKMKNFLIENDYSVDIIRKATEAYVADRKKVNYQYMKKFTNFINKQGDDSLLATWCEMIKNDELNSDNGGATRITKTL